MRMTHLPFRRDLFHSDAASSPYLNPVFPQRTLHTISEHELDNPTNVSTSQERSSSPCVPTDSRQAHSLNMELLSQSLTSSSAHAPTSHSTNGTETSGNQGDGCRQACGWTILARLVLHIISLAASVTVIGLLAQALLTHRKLRQIRQFNGSDSAWPRQMSLTPSILLLSVASTSVAKSVISIMADVHRRKRSQSFRFLVALAGGSFVIGAIWVSTGFFIEEKRKNSDDFTTWSCVRSDAAVNQIVPYKAICDEQVRYFLHCRALTVADTMKRAAIKLGEVASYMELVIAIGCAVLALLTKYGQVKV